MDSTGESGGTMVKIKYRREKMIGDKKTYYIRKLNHNSFYGGLPEEFFVSASTPLQALELCFDSNIYELIYPGLNELVEKILLKHSTAIISNDGIDISFSEFSNPEIPSYISNVYEPDCDCEWWQLLTRLRLNNLWDKKSDKCILNSHKEALELLKIDEGYWFSRKLNAASGKAKNRLNNFILPQMKKRNIPVVCV